MLTTAGAVALTTGANDSDIWLAELGATRVTGVVSIGAICAATVLSPVRLWMPSASATPTMPPSASPPTSFSCFNTDAPAIMPCPLSQLCSPREAMMNGLGIGRCQPAPPPGDPIPV